MQKTVFPSEIAGRVQAPPSKSVAQRAIAIAGLTPGLSRLHFTGSSDDVKAAVRICTALGASIQAKGQVLQIRGGLLQPSQGLDCGESGLSMRMFAPIAALFSEQVVLEARGSLLQRPMEMVCETLRRLGVDCTTSEGKAPLKIKGPLQGGKLQLDGSSGSQVLTGLLIAAPYAAKPLEIQVTDLKSKPYIDLTLQVMAAFGVTASHEDYRLFRVDAPRQYQPADFVVEGDWSGAAFLLVAGAVAGEVTLTNLQPDSLQPDRKVLEVLEQCGADLQISPRGIAVRKKALHGFDFDATHCPDLFPPLVALAAHCQGISSIEGVHRLAGKESDRNATLQQEFKKMGIEIFVDGDKMKVKGGITGQAVVDSHHDHRIAMACAVAALAGKGAVAIENAQAVNKSYPDFFEDLNCIIQK